MPENKYAYWIRGAFFKGFQNLSIVIFGVMNFVLLARATTKEVFGTWALFLLISNITEMSKNGLLKNGMMKYINSTPKEDHPAISSASLFLNSTVTLVIMLLIVVLGGAISRFCKTPVLEHLLFIYLIALAMHILFSHCEFTQCSYGDFKGISWAYFSRQAVLFLFIAGCKITGHPFTLVNLTIYYVISMFIGTFISLLFCRKYFNGKFRLDFRWVNKLWNYGKYVLGTNASFFFFRSTDHFIVASYISVGAVALYNTAVRIKNFVDLPSNMLSDILFPRTASSMVNEGPPKVKYLYEKSVGAVLALSVPASLFIFLLPSMFLRIIAGNKYVSAVPVLQVTLAFGIFLPFMRQFGTIMDSIGKPKTNFLVNFSTALFNIGVNLYLTLKIGLLGAAYGTLISYFFCFLAGQVILYREFNIRLSNTIKFAWKFYPEILKIIMDRIKYSRGSALETIENEIL